MLVSTVSVERDEKDDSVANGVENLPAVEELSASSELIPHELLHGQKDEKRFACSVRSHSQGQLPRIACDSDCEGSRRMAELPITIFYAYAPEDTSWALELEKHLTLLQRQKLITTWHPRLIRAGEDWQQVVDTHIQRASVILLLISPDFLASDYCYSSEMRQALSLEQTKGVRVVPILLRPVNWEDAPFAHLHPLPSDATFLTEWSNIDRAFAEITAGLRRTLEDLLLLAMHLPQNAVPTLWNVPFARNPFFLGQEEELSRLRSRFVHTSADTFPPAQAITGLGGLGKTQLAIEYAYRYRQDYQATFWVHAHSTETLYASYAELAQMLNLPQASDRKQETVVLAVKTWLQNHEHWLIILDNADEPEICLPFLPSLLRGHVLLTTRASALRRLGIAHVLTLESLPATTAALLLLRRAGYLAPDAALETASTQDQTLALQLVQELGSLPLALDQAGAYLEATGMSLDSYLQIYQQYQGDLLAEHYGQKHYHPEPVATTWQLAFQRVQANNPAAAALLHVCAFLHPEEIAEAFLIQGGEVLGPVLSSVVTNRYLFEKALETLRAYSLITRDAQHQTLGIHRLVQSVIRASLPLEEQQLWMQRVISLLARAFPTTIEVTNWVRCESLLPHVLLAAAWCEQDPSLATAELAYVLNQGGYFLTRRARLKEVGPLLQQALTIRERVLGEEHPQTAQSIHNLAEYLAAAGNYEQAAGVYERAKDLRERVLGAQHLETAQTMMALGRLYREQGNYERARPLLERVLSLREQLLGTEHPETARSLHHLAYLARKQGHYQEAETLLLRSLSIWKQVREGEHPDSMQALNTLAGLYREQGRYSEAEPIAQQVLSIWERALGAEHPTVLRSVNNLAGLYREQGRYEQAKPLYERVLSVRKRVLGIEHPETAQALNNLAGLYRDLGSFQEAKPLFEQALNVRSRILGASHPLTAQTLHNLAGIACSQGHFDEAEVLYMQALAIRKQVLGAEHPDTLRSLSELGRLSIEQKRYEQAESLLLEVLSIQKRLLGESHPETLQSMSYVGRLYSEQRRDAQAESLLEQVLGIAEHLLGSQHPALIFPLSSLAALVQSQLRWSEAMRMYERLLAIQTRVLGESHPETLVTRGHLASLGAPELSVANSSEEG